MRQTERGRGKEEEQAVPAESKHLLFCIRREKKHLR